MEAMPTRGAVLKGSLAVLAAGLLAACAPGSAPGSAQPGPAQPSDDGAAPSARTSPPASSPAQRGSPAAESGSTPSPTGLDPRARAAARARLTEAQRARLDQDLIRAAKRNDPAEVKRLIEQGGDVNAKDSIQDSAFLYAGAEGFNDVLRLTLAAGADVRSTNRFGGTALIPACEHGHVETIRILIAAGVPVNHVNRLGWTGMQEAILLNAGGPRQQEAVRLLLAAGADPGIRDPQGRTALDNARRMGFTEIVRILESHRP
ncbi:ankyrin repeat domain-containing protein [Arthrobacter sp. Y-9]|uniref:ankyrin repeat domain-containing protein n=1 Tax=Arthrobacter sp. Y-9 TaxID=3039385 RepID=UPI00241C292B|nr:ankyrin repeat domain-containing protein [Arthrobacter sp. Y-9]WFR85522.1 ankyrin repeat domain-containing protein [Arthrobacter sp. Y-9]